MITDLFKKHAKKIAVAAAIPFMTACGAFTKVEGQAIGAAIAGVGGELLGKKVTDRRTRNAITAGSVVVGGAVGGAIADRNVVCTQESSERRDTNVDYNTDRTTRDTGSASTENECIGGRQEGQRVQLPGLHN